MRKIALFLLITAFTLANGVSFTLNNYSLFYNFEYKDNPYYDGRTFFGDTMEGFFSFSVNKQVTADVGVILWRFYGGDRELLPYFSISFTPKPWFTFVFGNIKRFHGLHRSIFFDTFYYDRPAERGFQLLFNGKRTRGDIWINWQREMRVLVQEKFDVGAVFSYDLDPLSFDFQYHYIHYGGEYLEHHAGPRDETALMGRLNFATPQTSIGRLKLSLAFFRTYYIPDRWLNEILKGKGWEARLSWENRIINTSISYWKGEGFYHEDGDPLYQGKELLVIGLEKAVKLKDFQFRLILTSGWVEGVWVPYQKIEVRWSHSFAL